MIQITSFPSQVKTEEFLTITGTASGYEGKPLTLTFENNYQLGAGAVQSTGTWSLQFRFTQAGTRRLVFSVKDNQGNIIRSQPITITVVAAPPAKIEATTFPNQIRTDELLTISGTANGFEGKALTLIVDDRFRSSAGVVAPNGLWNVQFRFTQAGARQLVLAANDALGKEVRSQPFTITVVATPVANVQITKFPPEVKVREEFNLQGTSSGLTGKSVVLTIDNQFKTNIGAIAADGSWQTTFQFLQPGTRRLTATIDNPPSNPVISNTVTINVVATSSQLTITPPTQPIRAGEKFVLEGEAKEFAEGRQLIVQTDGQYVLARPIVANQRWQAEIFFNQSGKRLVEVVASDQEKVQIELDVQASQTNTQLEILPYTVWTSVPTPASIPDLVNPKRVTLHHTVIAMLPANATQAQEIERMRLILDIHLNSSKFADIGYHYIVMPSGRVYEGRSSQKAGAHDLINDGFGVAVDGNFESSLRLTQKQFDTVVALCALLFKRMGLNDPVTPVSTTTYSFGTQQLPRILGHRDRYTTACPGSIYDRLPEIRQAVKAQLS
ncbi:MAG: peptidoglycan recognition protein family protein [Scytolyngbya sp. HA4215-MV1]|jgi:hypothetical protein|nr:peptidoglycan recognition protein family protein [Scytolyngbya sp. HA4215-MV1]